MTPGQMEWSRTWDELVGVMKASEEANSRY